MKRFTPAFAFLFLAACGPVEFTLDGGDATVTAVQDARGIEATLVRASDHLEAGSLRWETGSDTASLAVSGQALILPVRTEGRDLDAKVVASALYGAWKVQELETPRWCGLFDLYIATSSCDALVDPGLETQCVRDVLNDIC